MVYGTMWPRGSGAVAAGTTQLAGLGRFTGDDVRRAIGTGYDGFNALVDHQSVGGGRETEGRFSLNLPGLEAIPVQHCRTGARLGGRASSDGGVTAWNTAFKLPVQPVDRGLRMS